VGEDGLRATVEQQASRRAAGDVAAFASFMTPQALVQLRNGGAPAAVDGSVKRYVLQEVIEDGDRGVSRVTFSGTGVRYDIIQSWELQDGLWKAVEARRPPETVRLAWWRRLLGVFGRREPPAERKDLE
jgi:hypothetical protein